MIPLATEEGRYVYDLTPESIVIDAGAFQGDWSFEMAKRYNCTVIAFEPIRKFADIVQRRLNSLPKCRVMPFALGATRRIITMGLQNNSSGAFSLSPEQEEVSVYPVTTLINTTGLCPMVDVLKLNIEGMEFEVLEAIIENGLQEMIRNIQVQNHHVEKNSIERWEKIRNRLMETHEITWETPWVWTNFRLK